MAIIIKSTARVLGDGINSLELLKAMRSPHFKDSAPIQITCEGKVGFVKLIYRDYNCPELHFTLGDLLIDEHEETVNFCDILADHYEDGGAVTKKELISILERLPANTEILLESCTLGAMYKLTQVYKCSDECCSVHLACHYKKDAINPN